MRKKHLVVEDDDAMRNLLCSLFQDNFDILLAKNGQEALSLAKECYCDVILSDYNMPVMNGIEFLERARETDDNIYARSILLTGSTAKEVESFCKQNQILLISKPFSIGKLEEAVNMLLERNNSKYPHHVQDHDKSTQKAWCRSPEH